jgi:putative ABC transport system ATP-binding protein
MNMRPIPRRPRRRPLVERATPPRPVERARPPIIDVRGVSRVYRLGEVQVGALNRVDLRIERGEMVAVMGSSGSGKSTLMHILGCLDVPDAGSYLLDGIDVRELDDTALADVRNRKIGFVFQGFNLVPRTTALANVELPLAYAGLPRAERRRRAEAALAAVGMSRRLHHQPTELSGGQQQRVAIARAVVTSPRLILADEPTGNLDSHSTANVLDILERLHAEGRTVVIITHEPDVAERAQRIVRLSDGRVVEDTGAARVAASKSDPTLPVP